MTKNNWQYWTKVGFHLAVVSIPAMIIAWIISLPLALILGSAAAMGIVGSIGLLTIIEMFIDFLIFGYFVVRFKSWIFKNKII